MNEDDKEVKQQIGATYQYANIWNYNAHVEHQHNYYGGKPEETDVEEVFVPCELHFFDQVEFGSDEKQPKLIALLREFASQIDITSGNGWFCIYAGYRYYKEQLAVKKGYVEFFEDIEALIPDKLVIDDLSKTGDERYHKYTMLIGREVNRWYMADGKLPPLNEMTIWRKKFDGDQSRYNQNSKIIIDFYKKLKNL